MPYPQAVLADGPLLYYRLEELVGTRAFDSSGHGFHGTYSQNVGRQAGPGPGLGSSASFHETNSIAVPALNAVALQVTAEAWVQLNNWNNQIDVFNNFGVSGIYCGDSWELGSFQMAALNADQLQVSLWGAAGAGNGFSQRFFVPAPTFTTGPWYHIAAVYDGFGRTLTFYLNGDIVDVLNLGSAPPVNLTSAHMSPFTQRHCRRRGSRRITRRPLRPFRPGSITLV